MAGKILIRCDVGANGKILAASLAEDADVVDEDVDRGFGRQQMASELLDDREIAKV